MFDVLYGFSVAYLSIGFGLWLSVDAREFVHFTTLAHLRRTRRVPGKLLLAFSSLLIVLLWPKIAWRILDSIEVRRRGRT
jgi:hypothetical protein